MIPDFDDFCNWMFVSVDDLWQAIAPLYRRPGPDPTSCSDSELITVAIISECRTWSRETVAMQEWAAYRHLFPRLPERSRFNRRRRNLMGAINQIRQLVLTMLDVAQDAYGAIDSLPLPVMHFHLAPQRTHDWDVHGATFGYCASKKQVFFGYRLHLAVTLGGVILDFELTSANADERDVAADMLPDQTGRTFLADKGYVKVQLAEALAACGVRLIAARRVNQLKEQMMQTSHGSNKQQRDIQRIAHLVGAAVLMLYLYTPLGSAPIFTALMQFLVVPLLVATGMLMWQLPRLRKLLQGKHPAGQASKETS